MDSARTKLIKGGVKSAIAAITGSTVGTSVLAYFHKGIDPTQFNASTWTGIKNNLLLGLFVVGVAELRYGYQWIEKWANSDGTPQQ